MDSGRNVLLNNHLPGLACPLVKLLIKILSRTKITKHTIRKSDRSYGEKYQSKGQFMYKVVGNQPPDGDWVRRNGNEYFKAQRVGGADAVGPISRQKRKAAELGA